MTDDEQEARSNRFNGKRSCILVELRSGNVALFGWGGAGPLHYLGPPEGLQAAFFSRPAYSYSPAPRTPKPSKLGIDLSLINIDI